MVDNLRPPLRVQDQYNPDIDPRLLAIIEQAAAYTPFIVELRSGFRPGDKRQHGKHNAIDINLIDPTSGQVLPSYQDGANFREYEQFAQAARAIQMAKYPELEQDFRWGGYFGSKSGPFGYGALDLMHFDLAGKKIGMGQGSWENGLSPKMAQAYGISNSEGMGNNAKSRTYLATLTPGGYQPAPPDPATQTASLAAQRNRPTAQQLQAIRAVPGSTPGTAVEAIEGVTGTGAPDTRLALTEEPRVYDPSIPKPAPVPSFRREKPVPQPPIDVAEVYRGTPMETPRATPQTVETAEQIYRPFPQLRPEAAPKPASEFTPRPDTTGAQFSTASTDPGSYYPFDTKAPSYDPVVDPLADKRLADFRTNIVEPDGPADLEAPKVVLAGNSRAEELYQAATGKPSADANVRTQRAEQMSPALKAARERLAAARTAKTKVAGDPRVDLKPQGMAPLRAPVPATRTPKVAPVPATASPGLRNALKAPTPAFLPGNRLERLRSARAPIPATISDKLNAGRNVLSLFVGGGNSLIRGANSVYGQPNNVLTIVPRNSARDGLSGAQVDIAERQSGGDRNYQSLIEWAMRS